MLPLDTSLLHQASTYSVPSTGAAVSAEVLMLPLVLLHALVLFLLL